MAFEDAIGSFDVMQDLIIHVVLYNVQPNLYRIFECDTVACAVSFEHVAIEP